MSEQTVIKGWHNTHEATYHQKGHVTHFFLVQESRPFNDPQWKEATLILGNGFSEETVRKMLEEIKCDFELFESEHFHAIASKYGIDL